MKKIIHQPIKIIIISLAIAGAVGAYEYRRINTRPLYEFAKAAPGEINVSGLGGAITGVHNFSLGFLVGGRIKSVSVKAGDNVHEGQVLAVLDNQNALGVLSQAKAALSNAQANLQKVVNGATGTAIDIAKAALNTAKVNLAEATKQQDLLVANAKRNLLNSTIAAKAVGESSSPLPVISGAYEKDKEGVITLGMYSTGEGLAYNLSGLVSGTGRASNLAQPIGDTGLFISFPSTGSYQSLGTLEIEIPNTAAPNYLSNYNAYQSALQTESQVVESAKAAVEQATANLSAVVTAARPEDVASAQAGVNNAAGAVQIAQAAYDNTVIKSPTTGSVTAVNIAPGQIALPNVSAIQLLGATSMKEASVVIPKNAVIEREGKFYVNKKTSSGSIETEVALGAADSANVEILSGLVAGDEVVIH
jgi:HlyD family secretion protein